MLPERDAELIALRYGADLTAKQIAEVTGMRTNAVEVALHRALGTLRQVLETGEAPARPGRRRGRRTSEPSRLAEAVGRRAAAADRGRGRRGGERRVLRDVVRLDGARVRLGAVIVLVLAAPRWGIFDRIWLIAAAALCLYTFVSAGWAGSVDGAVQGGERALVYLTGVAGALVVLRRGDFSRWLGGLVLGVAGVCIYSLATRLYPTHFGGFNTLGLPALRAHRLLERARDLRRDRAAARLRGGGAGPRRPGSGSRRPSALVVLAPTIYFTFSRGACSRSRSASSRCSR